MPAHHFTSGRGLSRLLSRWGQLSDPLTDLEASFRLNPVSSLPSLFPQRTLLLSHLCLKLLPLAVSLKENLVAQVPPLWRLDRILRILLCQVKGLKVTLQESRTLPAPPPRTCALLPTKLMEGAWRRASPDRCCGSSPTPLPLGAHTQFSHLYIHQFVLFFNSVLYLLRVFLRNVNNRLL